MMHKKWLSEQDSVAVWHDSSQFFLIESVFLVIVRNNEVKQIPIFHFIQLMYNGNVEKLKQLNEIASISYEMSKKDCYFACIDGKELAAKSIDSFLFCFSFGSVTLI